MKAFKKPSGIKVRAPSLCIGVEYQICVWDRRKTNSTPSTAKFLGWGTDPSYLTNDIPKLNSINSASDYRLYFDKDGEVIKLQVINKLVMIPYEIKYSKETRKGMKRVTFYYDDCSDQEVEHVSKVESNRLKKREKNIQKYGNTVTEKLAEFIAEITQTEDPFDLFNVDSRAQISYDFPVSYIQSHKMGGHLDLEDTQKILGYLDSLVHDSFKNVWIPNNKRSSYAIHKFDDLRTKINKLPRAEKALIDVFYEDDPFYKEYKKKAEYVEVNQDVTTMDPNLIQIVDNHNQPIVMPDTMKTWMLYHYVTLFPGAMGLYQDICDANNAIKSDPTKQPYSIKIILTADGASKIKSIKNSDLMIVFP